MALLSRRQLLRAATVAATGLGLPGVAAAAPAWVDQRQLGPFNVRASFNLAEYASLILELPQLELELRRVLALRPCRQPISIELLSDRREHKRYLAERFPHIPYRRALFVKQDEQSTVFAYRDKEMPVDLRHECTHALLHADLPMIPLWLDEGLAEYFEMPAGERAFGHPHSGALTWDLRFGLVEDLEALEAKHDLSEMTSADYRSAWAWTHFMLHGPQMAARQLWGFLADIRVGQPPGLLSERLAGALPGVEKMLSRHFHQWQRLASQQQRNA